MAKEEPSEYRKSVTTISVCKTTKKRLADICRKDQTYDSLLNEFMDERDKRGK